MGSENPHPRGAMEKGWLPGEGASDFCKCVASGRLTMLQWTAPHPVNEPVEGNGLLNFKKYEI